MSNLQGNECVTVTEIAASDRSAGPRAGWATRAASKMKRWRSRARGRRELLRLDDHLLSDIGVNRAQALEEALKPFWR